MKKNYAVIEDGMQITLKMLAPYVAQQLLGYYKKDWWQDGVLDKLYSNELFDLPSSGEFDTLVDSLDIARCLKLININWTEVFKTKLTREHRSWVNELIDTRNKCAHITPTSDFDNDTAWRALDTMARLMGQIDNETTNELRKLARDIREKEVATLKKDAENIKVKKNLIPNPVLTGVKPWTQVIQPHPDVAQGRYRQAEFAADLYQVYKGKAEAEYQDPLEFFNRTYVTEGMQALLTQALQRVAGIGGEPVIQLKTAFGGGKTHSMLALYHLLKSGKHLDGSQSAKQVLENAKVKELPKVNVAVLVGTAMNPATYSQPPYMPGIRIHTLWGEIAAQLAFSAGKLDVFSLVKEADRKGVAPGSEVMTQLFDKCGHCLVLIDELVAYARKIYNVDGLPAGSFDNLLTFIQELTEAARASKNSTVVASIPESDREIGGAAGQEAQDKIEHTFGRMESVWKPVTAQEGFEVVRRRLFLPVKDESSVEKTCQAYSNYYLEHSSDFPTECREVNYKRKMMSCYPIHPEFFDRLYNDWASLESFQRTRGVLRLMATLIYSLWTAGDFSLLIMPGSLLLEIRPIRDELTRYLSDVWNTIVDTEIDGKNATSTRLDKKNSRYTPRHICRRIARAILLGSAPDVKVQNLRGIEASRIRLGVMQPGENISLFNDALAHLSNNLSYLFSNNGRYWFDTKPNLRRVMQDRKQQVEQHRIEEEVERRLRTGYYKDLFEGVHVWPNNTGDVSDEEAARLVILSPDRVHKRNKDDSKATTYINECLKQRGLSPRTSVNMLLFLAPDIDRISKLNNIAKEYLAWSSIIENESELNLDNYQVKEAKQGMSSADKTLSHVVYESWCWLISPHQIDTDDIELEFIEVTGGEIHPVTKAENRALNNELVIKNWHPALLKIQADRYLWKDSNHCSVKEAWRVLSSYCYMPRLKNRGVLISTIMQGVQEGVFGWAIDIDDKSEYISLGYKEFTNISSLNGLIVKSEIAETQKIKETDPMDSPPQDSPGGKVPDSKPDDSKPKIRQYHGSLKLDKFRMGSEAGKISEEIVENLDSISDAEITITLSISAYSNKGIPEDVIRVVKENSKVLQFDESEFNE